MIGIVLAVPVGLIAAQLWHRMVDTLGTRPVRSVRSLGVPATPPAVTSTQFISALGALTRTPIRPGHQVELLIDGPATLARLEADLMAAQRSLAIQTYFCEPGDVTDRIKRVLMEKARQGLEVMFLADGFGCNLGSRYDDSLRAAGVLTATIRPLRWYSLHRAQHRSHVRAVIIDQRIGYTGGFGLADKWMPDSTGKPGWRETSVRFTGPAVTQLAGAFAVAWADALGELLAGDAMFPSPADSQATGGAAAGLLFTTRTYGTPVPERYLALSLAGARRTIHIVNPYFIPNNEVRRWLKDAAQRGVDVRVLSAGPDIDVKWTRWAAHTHYEELLQSGVKIYEYQPTMLHAKSMVIDGIYSSVGSLNLDNVSLRINDEAVLLVHDSALSAKLDSSFRADLEQSREISLEEFRNRPLTHKFREAFARIIRDFL